MEVRDVGFDSDMEKIALQLNNWAKQKKIYCADINFHINGHKVRTTDISRNFKHFYDKNAEGHEGTT